MTDFALADSFDVDNGELDGVPRHKCFVLGVEMGLFLVQLGRGAAFERPVHAENVSRLVRAARRRRRMVEAVGIGDGWVLLSVPGAPRAAAGSVP